jgi:solute carrier family 36 (proton-coupled amino acid transporter)
LTSAVTSAEADPAPCSLSSASFYNGGILFSTIVLCFIAMISLYSFLLLVETRLVVHGSFGGETLLRLHCERRTFADNTSLADIGGILYGKYMRWMILFSIVLSQVSLPSCPSSEASTLLTLPAFLVDRIRRGLHHLRGVFALWPPFSPDMTLTLPSHALFNAEQSQNLQAFVMAVTNCATYVPIQYLILAQLVIFLRESSSSLAVSRR